MDTSFNSCLEESTIANSPIESEVSSCDTSAISADNNAFYSCSSTIVQDDSVVDNEKESDVEPSCTYEQDDWDFSLFTSIRYMFISAIVLIVAVFVYLIFQSPLFTKDDCSESTKVCLINLAKDIRRYFDFYF